ncbi:MAG: hypothetical protein Kow0077_03920 [Anaerolineae bacterium]
MTPPVEIIQLAPDDDVVSVRDRIEFAESHRILLVWPPNGERVLQRKLDLILLQRAVRRRAARLALVTLDKEVIQNARDLNISTFSSVEESRRMRWRRGRSKVFVDRSDRPKGELAAGELREAATHVRMAPTRSQIRLRRLGQGLVLLTFFAAIVLTMVLLVPYATVTITPDSEQREVSVRVIADPSASTVDLDNSIVPASILRVEIEETAAIETTGSQDVAPTLARGTVVFTNLTNQAATIPAGTTVNTSTGAIVRFRTLEPVNIAGEINAIAAVAIEALPQFAGPVGNVPAYAINFVDGPLSDILRVENPDPTSGGMVPQERIVAASDHERLTAAVRGAIQQRAFAELSAMLGEHQVIIPETIHIAETRPEWTAFSAAVGDEADSVSLTMRAAVEAVVVDQRLVNQAAFAGLARLIPPDRVVDTESITFGALRVETIDASNRLTLLTTVSGSITPEIDIQQIRPALAGRRIPDAIQYLESHLELSDRHPVRVSVWPSMFDRLPLLGSRITVAVQGASS